MVGQSRNITPDDVSIAQWLESRSMDRAREAVRALMDLTPPDALVRDASGDRRVAVDRVGVVLLRRVVPQRRRLRPGASRRTLGHRGEHSIEFQAVFLRYLFGGDDLGDVEAFEAVRSLRADGLPGLVVCSASHEQPDLVRLADVVVDGPAGVVDLLGGLARRR